MVKVKLFNIRISKGISQEKLADLIGMTQSNYSRRENGLKKISKTEWDKIAMELGVKKEDIYEEDTNNIFCQNNKSSVNNLVTPYYLNIPDFVLEFIELLKDQNNYFKEENKALKERIRSYEGK